MSVNVCLALRKSLKITIFLISFIWVNFCRISVESLMGNFMHRYANSFSKTTSKCLLCWNLSLQRHLKTARLASPCFCPFKIDEFLKLSKKPKTPKCPELLTYEIVIPGNVSKLRKVPSHIPRPRYVGHDGSRSYCDNDDAAACSGSRRRWQQKRQPKIEIKNRDQINRTREACKLAREIMNLAVEHAKVGVTTDEIDVVVHEAIVEHGAYPSPLLYHGFPKSVCTSVNNVVCHGIPDDRLLKDGDIVSIDITVFLKGHHGDCCETVAIGSLDEAGRALIQAAKDCRNVAIEACGPGKPFSSIGSTINKILSNSRDNFKVVPVFCGHGIGSYFHGPPEIFHFENCIPGIMEPGMTFTIEPVISEGADRVIILEDGWTAVTTDHSRGAQFEHTILITDNKDGDGTGVEILTT